MKLSRNKKIFRGSFLLYERPPRRLFELKMPPMSELNTNRRLRIKKIKTFLTKFFIKIVIILENNPAIQQSLPRSYGECPVEVSPSGGLKTGPQHLLLVECYHKTEREF